MSCNGLLYSFVLAFSTNFSTDFTLVETLSTRGTSRSMSLVRLSISPATLLNTGTRSEYSDSNVMLPTLPRRNHFGCNPAPDRDVNDSLFVGLRNSYYFVKLLEGAPYDKLAIQSNGLESQFSLQGLGIQFEHIIRSFKPARSVDEISTACLRQVFIRNVSHGDISVALAPQDAGRRNQVLHNVNFSRFDDDFLEGPSEDASAVRVCQDKIRHQEV